MEALGMILSNAVLDDVVFWKEPEKKSINHETYNKKPVRESGSGIVAIDKIYCINLESSVDRKKHMKAEFKKHCLPAIFISAIHPKTKEFRKVQNKVDLGFDRRCFCINSCSHKKRKLRPTEIAISLSHYHIYRKIVRNHDNWALVCEDDITFIDNFSQIVSRHIPLDIWEDNQPHIIMCGGSNDNWGLKKNDLEIFQLRHLHNGCYSNYCYIINFYAAQMLLKYFFPIKRPEDSFKRHIIHKNKIHCHK